MKKNITRSVINLTLCALIALSPLSLPSTTLATSTARPSETVSLSDSEAMPSNTSTNPKVSSDGRYVFFASYASNLVPNDTNGYYDIFVRDRLLGTTQRVSVSNAGAQANSESIDFDISNDARYVVFSSAATNLVTSPDYNNSYDIYIRDLQLGTTSLIYRNPFNGTGATRPTISGDGNYITFSTKIHANNDTNSNIYIINRTTLALTRVSNGMNGAAANNGSYDSSPSYDGNLVAFGSHASNLVANDTNAQSDIFLWNKTTNLTSRLSVSNSGVQANHYTQWPHISDDGGKVVFTGYPTNITSNGTTANRMKAFLYNTGSNTISLLSATPTGEEGNGNSDMSDISADGTHAIFTSIASNLVSSDLNNKGDVFIRSITTNTTYLASEDVGNTQFSTWGAGGKVSLSNDGRYAVFGSTVPGSSTVIYLRDMAPLDTEAPTVIGSPDRSPDSNEWYRSDVAINWTAADPAPSTDIPNQPTPTLATVEGINTYTSEESCDSSGNCSTGSLSLKIDKTAPSVGTPNWASNPLVLGNSTEFQIPVSDTLSGVSSGEYFINTDPGLGNGTPLAWNGATLNSATFGSNLSPGVYTIGIRAQDAAGNWSAPLITYLVVFDPAGPTYIVGHRNITPTSSDTLPWLSTNPGDFGTFGMKVGFTDIGTVDASSKFNFSYVEKGSCGKATTPPCRTFILATSSFDWFAISGPNSSEGYFQGTASLTVNGATSTVPYRVEAKDGDRLETIEQDGFILKIYSENSNPQTSVPQYQITANFTPGTGNASGNIQIK